MEGLPTDGSKGSKTRSCQLMAPRKLVGSKGLNQLFAYWCLQKHWLPTNRFKGSKTTVCLLVSQNDWVPTDGSKASGWQLMSPKQVVAN